MSAPRFWSTPLRFMRWVSHEKPAVFYSFVVGFTGPAIVIAAPPFRRLIGDEPRPEIPMTYPIPKGPRVIPEGYDD